MREFALLVSATAILLFANLAAAQTGGDIMVGAGELWSPSPQSDLVNFHQPAEKNGLYPSVSADVVGLKYHLGLNVETSWRYRKADYPYNGETYRPFFTDINVMFQKHMTRKVGVDLLAGVGIADTRFYLLPAATCGGGAGGCTDYTSSNHFMEDLGIGVRYYVWRRLPRIFVRPEIHYYHIENNIEFHSSNVFRGSVSLGYTFGGRQPAANSKH